MALSWMGLASIPLCVTIKPRNLPELTPNAHFKGLSFMLCLRNNSKVFSKCTVWSRHSLDFTSISSIQTSMDLPISDRNIPITII